VQVKINVILERQMMKIPKQEYTTEFRELAIKRFKDVGSISGVAKELGLVEQTLCNWVKAADAGKLNGAGAKLITPEQMELSRVKQRPILSTNQRPIVSTFSAF
jgi:transposase